MKKLIPFCLAAAFAAPAISFVPANNIAVTPQFAATAEAAVPTVNALITTQQRLAKGVLVKHFCNSTTYIFKNDIELHKEFDNHYMNVAYHGCTNHRQILRWNL